MYADRDKDRAWRSAWAKDQRARNTPWAQRRRAENHAASMRRYWTDPEYRQRQIDQAAERVRKKRAAAHAAETAQLERAVASAKRLAARAAEMAGAAPMTYSGYTGKLQRWGTA